MLVNVWNLRFLEETNLAPANGIISAKLSRHGDNIEGSITNQAAFPLTSIVVRTKDGQLRLAGRIESGATIPVSGAIDRNDQGFIIKPKTQPPSYNNEPELPTTRPSLPTGGDIAVERSYRLQQLLSDRDNVACVYAEYEASPEDVKLDEPDLRQQHTGMVRNCADAMMQCRHRCLLLDRRGLMEICNERQ